VNFAPDPSKQTHPSTLTTSTCLLSLFASIIERERNHHHSAAAAEDVAKSLHAKYGSEKGGERERERESCSSTQWPFVLPPPPPPPPLNTSIFAARYYIGSKFGKWQTNLHVCRRRRRRRRFL
jgi:hypothetical protein